MLRIVKYLSKFKKTNTVFSNIENKKYSQRSVHTCQFKEENIKILLEIFSGLICCRINIKVSKKRGSMRKRRTDILIEMNK